MTVLKTFEKELGADDLNALKLLERARVTEGEAMPDEVTQVVTDRNGAILSASTILKSDFFSKMSLLEYVYTVARIARGDLILQPHSGASKGPLTSEGFP